MKTLLYLASGFCYPEYADLPFDKMIFVDRDRSLASSYKPYSPKIEFIGKDALLAIDQLKSSNLKIDCLVSVNEGLYQGGGDYPVFSDFLMGYLSPILNDEFTLICDLKYYAGPHRGVFSKLDLGFEKIRLTPEDKLYIKPTIFSCAKRQNYTPNYGNVFLMKKKRKKKTINITSSIPELTVVNCSIWEDAEKLDFIGLNLVSKYSLGPRCRSSYRYYTVYDFFINKPKVYDVNSKSIEEIIAYCIDNKLKRIGIVPWMKNHYEPVVEYLANLEQNVIESITFYHMNKNDFAYLYAL
jgi:hypothetical protein